MFAVGDFKGLGWYSGMHPSANETIDATDKGAGFGLWVDGDQEQISRAEKTQL